VDSSNGFLKVVCEEVEIPEPHHVVNRVTYALVQRKTDSFSLTRSTGGLAFVA